MILAAAAAALALPPSTPAFAQVEEEDIAASIAQYRGLLEEADGLLSSLEFAAAIESYTKLIEAYKSGQIPTVTTDAREMVAKAYEGRALALANLGRNGESKADFEALIRFDPTHTIDVEGVSPKIVALFAESKKALVGVVQVRTEPLGAEISLDGRRLGPSPLTDRAVLAGSYKLRIEKEGFDPLEETVAIEAGGRLEREVRLVPNARGIRVATLPRGVTVLVDGQERGVTFGRADATYEEVAREMGLDLAGISEPLLVPNLAPGEHEMTLKLECFEEVQVDLSVEIDLENNEPVAYKPFVLGPSRGSLVIESSPPGAQIQLDGSPKGKAPLTIRDLCSGVHEVVAEAPGLGRFAATVEVLKDQDVKVDARLRIGIAAFDLRAQSAQGADLGTILAEVERYSVVREGSGLPAELAQRIRLELESGKERRLGSRSLQEILSTLKVELVALALPAGALGDAVEFQLYGPFHAEPDRWILGGSSREAFRRVTAALERSTVIYEPWSGVKLIDVRGERNPVILAVTPGSPADTAGLRPGELLVTAGGSPIGRSSDLRAAIRRSSPGKEITMAVAGGEGNRELKVTLRATPIMLPPRDPETLYNKVIVDLIQMAALAGDDKVAAGHAWLDVGMALMHFRQWEAAIREGLRKAELPDAAGISLGTVRYLTGLCYERLGLRQEAAGAFELASASPSATLGTHDGPTLAPSARRRMAALGRNP